MWDKALRKNVQAPSCYHGDVPAHIQKPVVDGEVDPEVRGEARSRFGVGRSGEAAATQA